MSNNLSQATSEKAASSLDSYFKISERGSSVRQEVLAGLTTFWRWSIR